MLVFQNLLNVALLFALLLRTFKTVMFKCILFYAHLLTVVVDSCVDVHLVVSHLMVVVR